MCFDIKFSSKKLYNSLSCFISKKNYLHKLRSIVTSDYITIKEDEVNHLKIITIIPSKIYN